MEITEKVMEIVDRQGWDEDTKQDVYVHLLEAEEVDFPTEGQLGAYIYQTFTYLQINKDRKEANRRRILEENQDEIRDIMFGGNEGVEADPMDILMAKENMLEFTEGMSDTLRRTFQRIYLDGLTPEELAVEEGVARNAIDQRVHNIKQALKGEVNE